MVLFQESRVGSNQKQVSGKQEMLIYKLPIVGVLGQFSLFLGTS